MDGRRVVVVGGGYAGIETAKALDATAEVTLVDRKEVFFLRPVALRAAVSPDWTEAPFLSYDALLTRGRVLVGDVTDLRVDERVVVLRSGEELPYDALVLATGAAAPEPAVFNGTTAEEATKALRAHQERIAAAEHVLVVGGGPAGVELAAEIKAAHPGHRVTLAHGGPALLTGHSAKLARKAGERLRARGVEVLLDTRVGPEETLGADLVLRSTGTVPATGWLAARHPDWLDERGRLRVDEYLRVGGRPNVFAIGDVTDVDEPKLAQHAAAQGKEAAASITALFDGQPAPKAHKLVTSPMMLLPMGADDGVGQFPLGIVVGPKLTAAFKSKTLLIPYFRKALNLEAAK